MKYKGYFAGKTRQTKKTPLKVVIIVAVILAIFIPAIIAGVLYSLRSNNIDTPRENLMQVSLYGEDSLLHDEKENPKNAISGGLVAIFDSLSNNKTKVDNFPPDVYERKTLKAVISYNSAVSEYVCYFATDGTKSYCTDTSGNKYIIDDSSAKAFLNSTYAELLYSVATPPKLYTTSSDAVIPATADWHYKTVSGKELKAEEIVTQKEEVTYDMAGALGIIFDEAPDSCSVKIYKSGAFAVNICTDSRKQNGGACAYAHTENHRDSSLCNIIDKQRSLVLIGGCKENALSIRRKNYSVKVSAVSADVGISGNKSAISI